MADEAFVMQGLSAPVAEVARFSVGGTSMKQDGGELLRISRALYGLVDSLISSLEEFRGVENMLELKTAAGIVNTSPDEPQTSLGVETRPELLLVVAGTLKEMVGTLVSDIKANTQVQKLLPTMQKASVANHHAFFQDLIIPKQPSCSVNISPQGEEMPVCIPRKDSRTANGGSGKGQMICKHSCEQHPEVVDPWIWRKLRQELVELVIAKLPLPRIIELVVAELPLPSTVELRECFKAWYAMPQSSNFGEACSRSHPKFFGLLEWCWDNEAMWMSLHDIKSKEWVFYQVIGFPASGNERKRERYHAYRNSMYACDGGLVCFVPQEHLTSCPIVVCNPLTNIWKSLPPTPLEDFEIIMVQLVMEDDKKRYRVILVSYEKTREAFSAHSYNSKTGIWSIMNVGLVYGAGSELEVGYGIPYVFDCTTKTLFDLRRCASLASLDALTYSVAKDRLFVLHESNEVGERGGFIYLVSEYTWESSVADLRQLSVSESPVQVFPGPYIGMLFASPSFVLLLSDNCEAWHEDHHQLMGLYDVSAKRWDIPSPVPYGSNIHFEQLQRSFMCDLRWDINP